MELSDFESTLVKLNWISNRLAIVYNEFLKFNQDKPSYDLKSILREYTIVQLYSFIKIRRSLLKGLRMHENGIELDKCLKPLWQPIFDNEKGIRELRHSYLAHMQEEGQPFEKHIEDILFENKFPMNWG